MKKNILLVLLCAFSCVSIFAQDVIVKRDGNTILSKILEVNQDNIKYKKFKNLKGPTYTISIADINVINYENGEKDIFEGKIEKENKTAILGLIDKPVDFRNTELIDLYNKIYYPSVKEKEKKSMAKYYTVILGVNSNSKMSNEDIEITFVENSMHGYTVYNLNIKNKTDKVIYIDKGNSFKIYNNGEAFCFYDMTKQTTYSSSGSIGGSLGLGAVAEVLGIGGAIGNLAAGVNVGTSTGNTVSTTFSQQRFIAIPPNGKKNLTDERWVKVGGKERLIEEAESFNISDELKVKRSLHVGDVSICDEINSPWKRKYFLTYSTAEDFSTYSTLNVELYIKEFIGWNSFYSFPDLDEYTIYKNIKVYK